MASYTYIQMVPVQLNDGIDEKSLLEASDRFQAAFVRKQRGVVKRILMRASSGYADLVFFESKDDAERIAAAERTSLECLEFFAMVKPAPAGALDTGVLSFEHLRTYE